MTAAATPAATTPQAKHYRPASDGGAATLFLLPNIVGVIIFTAFPVVFSLVMAFTNWDLKQHNQFSDQPLSFVGFRNFVDLFAEGQFLRFLGNTLYFMIGIPLGIAGSLAAAMLLLGDPRPAKGRPLAMLLASCALAAGVLMLLLAGLGTTAMTLLLVGLFATIFVGGAGSGSTLYRTLFYMPHFVAGVPTFILWKKLYNPQTGPINTALTPVARHRRRRRQCAAGDARPGRRLRVAGRHDSRPCGSGMRQLRRWWNGGDLAVASLLLAVALLVVPFVVGATWSHRPAGAGVILIVGAIVAGAVEAFRFRRPFRKPIERDEGIGDAAMVGSLLMIGAFLCLGGSALLFGLPAMASDGLEPPRWLNDLGWAKPALMLMGFWAAIGSNTMLLVPGGADERAEGLVRGGRPGWCQGRWRGSGT